MALKRKAGINIAELMIDPGLSGLDSKVFAQEVSDEVSHIFILGEKNMGAIIENKIADFQGATEAAGSIFFLKYLTALV
jgi:hypothetical protein